MSGSVDTAAGVLLGPLADRGEAAAEGPAAREARWTLSRSLRRFSQLTFAYGVSAAFATVSAVIMSIPGGDGTLQTLVAILPFAVSLVIAGSVLSDLLELLWEGLAGRMPAEGGSGGVLWGATLGLLMTGVVAFAVGLGLLLFAFGDRPDFADLAAPGIAFLGVCGLTVLAAVVLPSIALGPPAGRWLATGAAALGSFALTEEALLAFHPPFGSSPVLGWMEGVFPLLNWNAGLGFLIAVSAFFIWWSYRYVLPADRHVLVPIA